jgi:hypothetical protein
MVATPEAQPMTRYGIVIAVELTRTHPLDPDELATAQAALRITTRAEVERHGRVEGLVDVAVREVVPGTGKVTDGAWGAHGI